MKLRIFLLTVMLGAATVGCDGETGPAGANGVDGTDGTNGTIGTDGTSARGVTITDVHGTDFLQSSGEYATGKVLVKANITGATADAAGLLTVNFTVADAAGSPVTTIPSIRANVAKLVPPPAGERSNRWVPYITRTETVSTVGDWPAPVGTTAVQGNTEGNGTLTNHGDGSYTYRFATNLSSVLGDGAPVTYERNRLHRVSVMMGGHDGATADANFDFVPDGSAATESRAIVQTAACKACHGPDFHGHGGDRLTVENCATCHAPGMADANGGESLDLTVMIHKIHAGGELASLAGADGIVWDNPSTPADESADNGEYAIWGYKNTKHEWWKAEFPAVLANCQKCHQGTGADVDAWKTNLSRAACGSCHDTVDFAQGVNHLTVTDDALCAQCHKAGGMAPTVTEAHDWTNKDPRNIPEFDVSLTISTPANGSYFVAGEAPVVTIKLKDAETGLFIDHSTIAADDKAEGCLATGCPPRDGLFRSTYLFVSGPRATRKPVLTTAARTQALSATTGPWDLSAASTELKLVVDNGQDVVKYNATGGDYTAPAAITVAFPATAFAAPTAATATEIVALLNGNKDFAARAIAFVEGGKVGVRSRNLGRVSALQLQAGNVTTAVFGGDTAVKTGSGLLIAGQLYFPSANFANDPKATRTAGEVTYTLDPVDDLAPGTYIASVEITERGSIDGTNYKTPSVAKVAFQVKTATVEKPVASNCDSCHQGPDGRGFVLDYLRHYKIFSDDAVDQCGACHDYQPGQLTSQSWGGGRPISKRVHAVHFGSSLFTPLATVDYSNGDPVAGRNWDITFPQDVRNCQACHPDGETSGSWASKPGRLACLGCHDSDAAKAHVKLQTWDPTPANPWSGDEEESCQACH